MRAETIPAGPSASVVETTLSRLRTESLAGTGRTLWMHPSWRVAAGVILVAGIVLLAVWTLVANQQPAFGQVLLQTLQQVRSVRFVERLETGDQTTAAEVVILAPARMRVAYASGPSKGMVTIVDIAERKGLVQMGGRRAYRLTFEDDPRGRQRAG